MNSIIKEAFICIISLSLLTSSIFLIMDLFSIRAKITGKRIRNYTIYTLIIGVFLIGVLGFRSWREHLLYLALLVNCFLFEEKYILTKTWKIAIAMAIENLLEFIVNIYGDWFYNNVWNSWIVYEFMVGVCTWVIIASVIAVIRKLKVFKPLRVESIIFSKAEAILLCVLAGCVMFNPTIAMILYINQEKIVINIALVLIWTIVSVTVSLFLILGIDKNIAQNYYQRVNELIETQFKNQVSYYEKIEESNKEIRAIKHDMKNHLISMQGLLHNNQLEELDNYIEDIRTTIGKKVVLIKTGNTIVDAILNEKNAVAHEKNIHMDIKVGVQEEINIELIDLCIILSNSIDNAIEACERVEDESKRYIKIKCSYRAGYFFYEITNSMKEEAISNIKNKLLTIKRDKKNHGFGVGNIKQSVRKYGGEVRTNAQGFEFKLEVEINTKGAMTLHA